MKKLFHLGLASLAMASVLSSFSGVDDKVAIVGSVDPSLKADGRFVYLADASGKHLDSVRIKKNAFRLEHTLVDSIPTGLLVFSERLLAPVFLEAGEIKATINATRGVGVSGTPQNDDRRKLNKDLRTLDSVYSERYKRLSVDSLANTPQAQKRLQQEMATETSQLVEATLRKHPNDALGARMFAFFLQSEEGRAKMEELLSFVGDKVKNDPQVKKTIAAIKVQQQTAVGKKFVDIEAVNAQGESVQLSQYVGRGHYTLVDFWASWCGPCRREIPNLISLYNSYKDKGLQVVGLVVWDKLPDHLKAVEQLKIPYPQILSFKSEDKGATTPQEATELYGVMGIPEIILFAPDGTILARGLRGETIQERLEQELKANGGKL